MVQVIKSILLRTISLNNEKNYCGVDRVMDLVKRKEQVQATDRKQKNTDEDASSEDEAEFDEFLDWRAKNSYK